MIIGILECWTNRPEWMNHGDFADWFPPFLRKADPSLDFQTFHAHLDQLPASPDQCDAWLLTGSAASVCENLPWQADLSDFVRQARAVRPIIGVCYGHQLLHQAFGGKVQKASRWGVGVHRYSVKAGFQGASRLRLLASHQDQVTQPANDTTILASSNFCPIAATQIGEDIITIQPHPEMTVPLAREVFSARREIQGEAVTNRALRRLDTPRDDLAVAQWMVSFIGAFSIPKKVVA